MAANAEPRKGYRLAGTFCPLPFSVEHFKKMEELLDSSVIPVAIRDELQDIVEIYSINKPLLDS